MQFVPICEDTDGKGTPFHCPHFHYVFSPQSPGLPPSLENCCKCKKCGFGKGKLGKFFPILSAKAHKFHPVFPVPFFGR
jgi:hypothetical protein